MKRALKLVGVGASAGGLDALIEFFKSVPSRAEVAFLVIQHLSPDHESIMAELLAPHVKLPIQEAKDGIHLSPGIIYLCPPAVIPRVDGLIVSLEPRVKDRTVVLPINILFASMARTLGTSAAAVVLSGTGSDGSEGVVSVSHNGGLVAVQRPDGAQFTGMPQSAISTGCPDIVAPASEIWALLWKAARRESIDVAYQPASAYDLVEAGKPEPFDEIAYKELFEYLDQLFGLNFSLYRINSVSRRLKRRMDLLGIPEIKEYRAYLDLNEGEAESLYYDLLIGVTRFFRDEASFKALAREGIKARMLRRADQDFRIWVAGCATGEEAYSIYILADEMKRETGFRGRIKVFATDVSKPSVERAGKGIFKLEQIHELGEERRRRYFQEIDKALYKIQPHVRENIIFAHHNFLTNAPFTNMDLVTCRNVLIYFKPEAQEAALGSFAYGLKDNGLLFLGGSESLGKLEPSFKTISAKFKIFSKRSNALDSTRWPGTHSSFSARGHDLLRTQSAASITINRQLLGAYDSLLERYAPSGFLINSQREVLHYFGQASEFCIHVTGRVEPDLVEQLDKHLKLTVTALIHRCSNKGERVCSKGVRCLSRSGECVVDVAVEPLHDAYQDVQAFLVEIARRPETKTPASAPVDEKMSELMSSSELEAAEQVKVLEDELRATRENLEAANEELQVSNEELQALNEEMQVSNEELQSTNEELHSLNEELTTLNAEYERKNEELIQVNASHENLLESTEDGVLYVDRDMCIRQFNSAIHHAFNLMQNDLGRPLAHIAYRMQGKVPLEDDVRLVLETGERVERESDEVGGRTFMKRIVPYRGADGEIDGALLTFTDVTEQTRLEKRFEFALRAAKLSWWDWDIQSGQINVYSSGECLLGEGCLSVVRDQEGWLSEVHPDDREMVEQSLDAFLRGATDDWQCRHRFRTISGGWIWVSNQGMVLRRSPKGEPLEVIGTTQDINDVQLALNEATSQRDMLKAAGDIAQMGYWNYDPATHEIEWSAQIRKILAVDDDFDPSVEGFYEFVSPADLKGLQTAFRRAVENGEPYDLELQCTDKNGRQCIALSSARPLKDESGKVVRVVGVFQDVTDIMETEHEMKAFFALSPDFQATVTYEGKFKSFNGSWEKQLGYSANDLDVMSLCEIVIPEERAAFKKQLQKVIQGEVITNYETRIVGKNSQHPDCGYRETWLSWSMSSDPDLRFVMVSARCVTAQKEAHQALQEARIRAEEASRAKTDFLAVMSHELRTPLNPILGYADMLLEEVENEEHKEILGIISRSGDHMISLIDELLDYSKLDAGKTKVDPVDFSLSDLVASKVRLMSGMLKNSHCALKHSLDWGELDESASPVMRGDVGMLRQILRNLISNAIKFTENGQIYFHTCVSEITDGKAWVEFTVADTGIGIASEDIGKLFKPFSQVDVGMTRKFGGTGLGLAICQRLTELLGGKISVQSKLGEGSTFKVKVPFDYRLESQENTMQKNSEKELSQSAASGTHQSLSGEVLVVEDNESNAYYIQKLVEVSGARPSIVFSGEEALALFPEKAYQLVLLDLHMPGIGGIETLKRLREAEAQAGKAPVPVVVLTADASAHAKKESLAAVADELLTKPVRPLAIKEILSKYLKPG